MKIIKKDPKNKVYEIIFIICIISLLIMIYGFFNKQEKIPNPYIAKDQKLRIPKEDYEREKKMFDFLKQVKEPIKPEMEDNLPKDNFIPDKGESVEKKNNPK